MNKFIKTKSLDKKILDENTGEILDLIITKKVTQEQFVMLFFSSIPELMSLTGNQLKLLMICWKNCTADFENSIEGNIINNTPYFKEKVRTSGLNLNNAAINVEMCRLAKKGILISKGFSTYMLNPEYFFKGRLSDRSKLLLTFCSDALKKE